MKGEFGYSIRQTTQHLIGKPKIPVVRLDYTNALHPNLPLGSLPLLVRDAPRVLIAGHDAIFRDGAPVAESLGGAVSFISSILRGLSIPFDSSRDVAAAHQDRVLKRVAALEPISLSDLPIESFDFGMAVGVGGEILPETLEKMTEIRGVVIVDIQGLIREFDSVDRTVRLVDLKDSGWVLSYAAKDWVPEGFSGGGKVLVMFT
ncbi:hypothetical protein SAY86_018315 [Trapa natans]|uniref:Uncharacterized protein n=1 Tax=Trapa natans TaxID=22666 RepID=A0AAN7QYP6_TRANT|nr:hypothetical protein SAY86_018315 [Trapa natans]